MVTTYLVIIVRYKVGTGHGHHIPEIFARDNSLVGDSSNHVFGDTEIICLYESQIHISVMWSQFCAKRTS